MLQHPHLKIALFTYSTKPRGSVIHTIELAEALQQAGQQVCIYALDKEGTGFGRSLNCEYVPVPAQPAPSAIDALIHQRIQEFVEFLSRDPLTHDCYHAQDCLSANALAILRQQSRIPHFVRTVHHIEDYNSPYLQACQEKSIREPDLCLSVSRYWQQMLRQHYQIEAPRVINGVNVDRFSALADGREAALKQQLGLTGTPVYLSVGGIEPRKNSIPLLQAFLQVLRVLPDAQLVIAGGATLFDYQDYRNEFFALVQQSQIEVGKSLILPGVIPDADLSALYRTADAFVFPSVKEGWGLVVLEALASGLPVVTSNQPPFTEFLSSQQALLIDPNDTQSIANAMLQIVQPDMAQAFIANSRSIPQQYSWQQSAQLHLAQYQRLCHPEPSLSFAPLSAD